MKREMTPIEYEELKEALLSAFPSPESLEQMVAFKLGENLQVIAGGNNYGEVVFHLLQWVEANNKMEQLITGARETNTGNFKLRAFGERYLQHHSTMSGDNEGVSKIETDQKNVEFPPFISEEKKIPEKEKYATKISNETRDFFISYTHTDQESAEWVDWQLRNAGYSTVLQSKDFRPGSNFVLEMDLATRQAKQTLLILSPDYLNALYVRSEWAAAFFKDPTGKEKALIPVRVRACEPEGLLGPVVYIDLVGLGEDEARKALLAGVLPQGERTHSAPPFPSGKADLQKDRYLQNNEKDETELSAVILTALRVEYMAVRAHLEDLHEVVHKNGTVYERGKFFFNHRFWNVGIVEIGAGNSGAATATERAIQQFQPKIVLFVGVAGGLKDVAIGDVVASTKVYGYESGKAEETFKPRPSIFLSTFLSTYRIEQRARTEARKDDWRKRIKRTHPASSPNVLVGPIAAGEKVLASSRSSLAQFLKDEYGDALAVEMEGYGFLEAVHTNDAIEALVVRGISDLLDKKGKADASGSQLRASAHASAFAFEILAKIGIQE